MLGCRLDGENPTWEEFIAGLEAGPVPAGNEIEPKSESKD